MRGVERGELESGYCAGVEVKRGYIGFGFFFFVVVVVVVFGVLILGFRLRRFGGGGLGAVEDAEIAHFVAGEY